jgi:aryl sulfotransferase
LSDVVWLASYPKSGNTWFRMLVANLRQDKPVDINDLPDSVGIASARTWFDGIMLFPSGLLTHEEVDRLRPQVHRAMAADLVPADPEDQTETRLGAKRFIKTHDAYTYTVDGEPLLGGGAAAGCAILIVRDPRDVATSLAHHIGRTVDQAIDFMGSDDSSFSGRRDRQTPQLRQRLPTWAGYNTGWIEQADIPVQVVRYEDLKADTPGVLRRALAFAGVEVSEAECEDAARFADFDALKQQEIEKGFREVARAGPNGRFFRRGVAGGWRDELTPAQIARIEGDQAVMMKHFGYHPDGYDERMTG